jgi:hypothetical protein
LAHGSAAGYRLLCALALIIFAGALSSLAAALFPSNSQAPVELFHLVAALALVCSVLLWWLGDRVLAGSSTPSSPAGQWRSPC